MMLLSILALTLRFVLADAINGTMHFPWHLDGVHVMKPIPWFLRCAEAQKSTAARLRGAANNKGSDASWLLRCAKAQNGTNNKGNDDDALAKPLGASASNSDCSMSPGTTNASYVYELILDISKQTGTFSEEFTYFEKTTTMYKSVRDTFKSFDLAVEAGYKESASLSFKGPIGGEESSEMWASMKTAMTTSVKDAIEKGTTTTTEQKMTYSVTVEPGKSFRLYQLHFNMPGFSHIGALTTNPYEAASFPIVGTVVFNFDFLAPVIEIIGRTKPTKDNKAEWDLIQNTVANNIGKAQIYQMDQLLLTFQGISPKRDNKSEWEVIREQSTSILRESDCYVRAARFLYMMLQTEPKKDNKKEWEKIRDAANSAMGSM